MMKWIDLDEVVAVDIDGTMFHVKRLSYPEATNLAVLAQGLKDNPKLDQTYLAMLDFLESKIDHIDGIDKPTGRVLPGMKPADIMTLVVKLFDLSNLSEDEEKN